MINILHRSPIDLGAVLVLWCLFQGFFFLQTVLPKFESIEKSYRQAYFEIWNFMCTFFLYLSYLNCSKWEVINWKLELSQLSFIFNFK